MKTIKERAEWLLATRRDAEVTATEWVGVMGEVLKEIADAPEPEPVAWAYSDNFGTHVTSDKSEFWGVPGIESFTELYTSPPAPSVPDADLVRDAERLRTAHRLLTMNAIGYDEWIAAVDKMTAIERDKKGGAA